MKDIKTPCRREDLLDDNAYCFRHFYISREDNMIVFAYGITETGKLAVRRMPLHICTNRFMLKDTTNYSPLHQATISTDMNKEEFVNIRLLSDENKKVKILLKDFQNYRYQNIIFKKDDLYYEIIKQLRDATFENRIAWYYSTEKECYITEFLFSEYCVKRIVENVDGSSLIKITFCMNDDSGNKELYSAYSGEKEELSKPLIELSSQLEMYCVKNGKGKRECRIYNDAEVLKIINKKN